MPPTDGRPDPRGAHPAPKLVAGQPDHYATAHLHAGYALGTVITHQMDRPIKVEGHPNHPSSLGATDPFAQAELLDFYDPVREAQVMSRGQPSDRQHRLTAIADARARMATDKGAGFRLLTGTVTSPSLAAQIDGLLQTWPAARWHQWEPFNRDNALKGAQVAYGSVVDVVPHTYNRLFTMHGIIMVWFFLVPSIPVTLGNFCIPLMIGARDLAFPKINLMSWYLFVLPGLVVLYALFVGGLDVGWTFYPPLSTNYSNGYRAAGCHRHLRVGVFLDRHRPEFHRHHPHAPRARHDLDPAAGVRVVALRHQHDLRAGHTRVLAIPWC